MDEQQLMEKVIYNVYADASAHTEMPGCSLCMGNQARIAAGFYTDYHYAPKQLNLTGCTVDCCLIEVRGSVRKRNRADLAENPGC
jgi:hypothetical protein